MSSPILSIWSVYDYLDDLDQDRHSYIAKRFELVAGDVISTGDIMTHTDLDCLRSRLENAGLYCIPRYADDDPTVIETWV